MNTATNEKQPVQIASMIGEAKPATDPLLIQLGESVRDRLAHDHSTQREDWYCMNLTAFMGERMGPVLRRLLDAEAEVARLRQERHETNEALSEAAEALRAHHDTAITPTGFDPVEDIEYKVAGDWGVDGADTADEALSAVRKALKAYPHCGAYAEQRITRRWDDGSEWYGPWTALIHDGAA